VHKSPILVLGITSKRSLRLNGAGRLVPIHQFTDLDLPSLIRYRHLVWQLTKREVIGKYRGSIFGFLWSFLNRC
jgi:hypothetical protein